MNKLGWLIITPFIVMACAVFAQVATEQIWPPHIRICEHCDGEGEHWNNEKELVQCHWCYGEGGFLESSVDMKTYCIFFFSFLIPSLSVGGYLSGYHVKFWNVEVTKDRTEKIERGKENGSD